MTDAAVLPASATTRRAVRALGFGERTVVLDTNVRRVLTRVLVGQAVPTPHLTAADRDSAAAFLPSDAAEAAVWNVGLMELGALVCTVRTPDCEACPLAARYAWLRAGKPADVGLRPRDQPWAGTDRQARGRIMAAHPGVGRARSPRGARVRRRRRRTRRLGLRLARVD